MRIVLVLAIVVLLGTLQWVESQTVEAPIQQCSSDCPPLPTPIPFVALLPSTIAIEGKDDKRSRRKRVHPTNTGKVQFPYST